MATPGTIAAWKRAAMIAAPLLLILFSLLHGVDELILHGMPTDDEWLRYLTTIQERWLALHLVGLGLFPLLGFVVLWMLPPRQPASRVSRVSLAIYIVLYPAFDALIGIGSYILIQYRQTLPDAERMVLDPVIKGLFFDQSSIAFLMSALASMAWGIGVMAAAVALWREVGWRVGLPLVIAGLAMSIDHAPPFGALAGIALGVAVWQYLASERRQPAASVAKTVPVSG